jgi:hypothetical protein
VRSFIFATLAVLCLVTPALAAEPKPGDCYQKTITVCVPKKPKAKKPAPPAVAQPTPPAAEPAPAVVVVERTVTKTVPGPTKTVLEKCNKEHVKPCLPDESEPRVGVYAALGAGVRDQYVQGNVGFQVRIPKAYLGIRLFTALDKGIGAQGLIYVYQSPKVKVHVLDPGIVASAGVFSQTNNTDVPRQLDMIFGAGVQVRLKCDLHLLIDWRVNLADPVYLAENDHKLISTGPTSAKYLDAPHVVGNSFSSSMLMVGILYDLPNRK